MSKNKSKKKAIHTILVIDVSPDPRIFDMQWQRVLEIHKKEKKDYEIIRGDDIVITCGKESRSFNSLKSFKKFMGFKL